MSKFAFGSDCTDSVLTCAFTVHYHAQLLWGKSPKLKASKEIVYIDQDSTLFGGINNFSPESGAFHIVCFPGYFPMEIVQILEINVQNV